MLKRNLLYSIDQLCVIFFGANSNLFRIVDTKTGERKKNPHPKYYSMRREFMYDPRVKTIGTGKKNRHYLVPGYVAIEKLGDPNEAPITANTPTQQPEARL